MRLLSVILAFLLLSGLAFAQPKAWVQKGVVDLRNWDFSHAPSLSLDGDWQFFWEKQTGKYIQVPGAWNQQPRHSWPRTGMGIYQCKILLPKTPPELGLYCKDIPLAYRITANGKHIGGLGRPGPNPETHVSRYGARVYHLPETPSGELLLTITVSNFDDPVSGLTEPIKLGEFNQLNRKFTLEICGMVFIFGILLFLSIYHITLFMFRPCDRINLNFGLIGCVIGLRVLTIPPRFLVYLFPKMSFQMLMRVDTLLICLGLLAIQSYVFQAFIQESPPRWVKITATLIPIFYILIILATPYNTYIMGMTGFQIFLTLSGLVTIWIIGRAAYHRNKDAYFLLAVACLGITCAINDILYMHRYIQTFYAIPYGFLVVMVSHSIILSSKFSQAFTIRDKQSKEQEILYNEVVHINRELEKANRIKANFLNTISHELRTPIHAAAGLIHLLVKMPEIRDHARIAKAVETTQKSIDRLANVILEILKFKDMQDQISLNLQMVKIQDILHGLYESTKNKIGEKPIAFTVLLKLDPAIECYTDRLLIQEMLDRLLANAIQFTYSGTVDLIVEKLDDMIQFTIQDTGIGMDKDMIDSIFAPFTQEDQSQHRVIQGLGLGLSICKRIVDRLNGEISITSTVEKGTHVVAQIPIISGFMPEEFISIP